MCGIGGCQIGHYPLGRFTTDTNSIVRSTIPGIYLTHACQIQSPNRCLKIRNILRVVYSWQWLCISIAKDPVLFDPVGPEVGIEVFERSNKPLSKFVLA